VGLAYGGPWGVAAEQVPWLQTPTIFDIRTRPRSISSITGTKDLQMVNITLRVLSKPNVDMLPEIYKVRGTNRVWRGENGQRVALD
jgi:hypothetical protein